MSKCLICKNPILKKTQLKVNPTDKSIYDTPKGMPGNIDKNHVTINGFAYRCCPAPIY